MDAHQSIVEEEETYQISDDDEYDNFDDSSSASANKNNLQFTRGPYERAWTTDATRALIHIRGPMEEEFNEGRSKRTSLWIQVTKQLHKMGFRYSSGKVQKKWHNILITYNKNIGKKEESGYVHWEFFEDMYKYLKGKKAITFDVRTSTGDGFAPQNQQQHQDQMHLHQQQHQQIHQHLQAQLQQPSIPEKTESIKQSAPSTSHFSNNNENQSHCISNDIQNHNGEINYEPKPKQMKTNDDDMYYYHADHNRLPLEISHVEGGSNESKPDNNHLTEENEIVYDSEWWKDYFNRKLDTEREKIDLQKQMHRDLMNYNKMCLIQQEKIERIKIEAINSLTATLQKLVEVKNNKK